MSVVLPDVALIDAFERWTKVLDTKIRNTTAENQTLTTLRDTLLPKLMSGELRVGAAREQVEEVV